LTLAQDELQTIGAEEEKERRRLDEIRNARDEADLQLRENKE
jgi:hypothetical protein